MDNIFALHLVILNGVSVSHILQQEVVFIRECGMAPESWKKKLPLDHSELLITLNHKAQKED